MATRNSRARSGSRRERLVYEILRTAGHLRHSYADLFDGCGITYQQYNVLRILRGAGAEGLPTLEIVNRMIDQAPGITRLLDRLQAKRLIWRQRPANNRRTVVCHVTDEGLELLRQLDPQLQQRVRGLSRRLSDTEIETLLGYLERIRGR
jgi:DNA-binding MarR family transcriptional regulator